MWNWFQNRRYAVRAKTVKAPEKLGVTPMPRNDSTVAKSVPQTPQSVNAPSGRIEAIQSLRFFSTRIWWPQVTCIFCTSFASSLYFGFIFLLRKSFFGKNISSFSMPRALEYCTSESSLCQRGHYVVHAPSQIFSRYDCYGCVLLCMITCIYAIFVAASVCTSHWKYRRRSWN